MNRAWPSMRFLPYSQVASVPNAIVDGTATRNTILTLSHWPKSGTPAALKADTSAEIVFRYLDTPSFHVQVEAVSNNHFDEDGLIGIFAMIEPASAERHRVVLVDAARAGDFGVYERREAARLAFVLSAYSDPESSPLPQGIFSLPYAELAAELYRQSLELLRRLLAHLDDYRSIWQAEDARLTACEALIDRGVITIEEEPALDLAVVRIPEEHGERDHPFALHSRTNCTRMVFLRGRRVELQYRYESWVQLISRTPLPRIDLSALAAELNRHEETEGRWVFDGVEAITPRLHFGGASASSTPARLVVEQIREQLRTGAPAWDPYD